MDGVNREDSGSLQAGGHQFDPGHVQHFFLIAKDLLHSSLPQSLIFLPLCTNLCKIGPILSHCAQSSGAAAIATAADGDTGTKRLDLVKINRGRLIGNLERLVLTLVVVAGSYAALGFLVAAKGLIRSEELQEREFAEYFLVGSLCSVLVALCAGLVIRYTLLGLWPELLSLQMGS